MKAHLGQNDNYSNMLWLNIFRVVSVGGDGMFHEVLNGLLMRAQQEAMLNSSSQDFQPVPLNIPIGIIPAGSTDAIAFCTTGNNDPVTSALHIILGTW